MNWFSLAADGSADGHDYVDLGLPSGTLWATCNVGANAPEEYGAHFAWGETVPKTIYDWSTYKYCKYCNDNFYLLTKYYKNDPPDCTIIPPWDDSPTDYLSRLAAN